MTRDELINSTNEIHDILEDAIDDAVPDPSLGT